MGLNLTDAEWQEAAEAVGDDLLGTCVPLETMLERHDIPGADQVMAFCHRLDVKVACCETCSWWWEPCDVNEDGDCTDCAPDEDQ